MTNISGKFLAKRLTSMVKMAGNFLATVFTASETEVPADEEAW